MKETDALKQYAALRDSITQEREKLISRLREIDAAFGSENLNGKVLFSGGSARSAHARNEMSLKETVMKVLEGKSLTKHEILEAVIASGYQFATADPLNSLGVVLYGKNPKFQKVLKRFSLKQPKSTAGSA